MKKRILSQVALVSAAAALMVGGTSCSEVTAASDAQKGAAIGAAAGGVVGGVHSRNQHGQVRPLGVGVGAAAGAAGGYFIGKKIEEDKADEARMERLERGQRERHENREQPSRY